MSRRSVIVAFFTLVFSLALPASALADSGSHTYQFHLEVPNVSQASSGDTVAVTGSGTFATHPKAAAGTGTFTHTDSNGTVLASGTWVVTELLEYQSYGCGVLQNVPTPGANTELPANLCGGALKLRVALTPRGTTLQVPAILTIFCIIGPNPPNNHDDPTGEGIHLVVPSHGNFNKIVTGMNVFIQQT